MAKKSKVAVSENGDGSALTHNPFAALGAVTAPAASAPTSSAASTDALHAGSPTQAQGRLILRREKKGRGGKTVVVISGFSTRPGLDRDRTALAELTQHLKQQLGCGGTLERADGGGAEPEIVLQGDQPARVAELLRARGFRVDGVTS